MLQLLLIREHSFLLNYLLDLACFIFFYIKIVLEMLLHVSHARWIHNLSMIAEWLEKVSHWHEMRAVMIWRSGV